MQIGYFLAEVLALKGHDKFETSKIIHHKDLFRKFSLKHGFPVPKAFNAEKLNLVAGIFYIQFIIRDKEIFIIEICRRTLGDLYVKLVEFAEAIKHNWFELFERTKLIIGLGLDALVQEYGIIVSLIFCSSYSAELLHRDIKTCICNYV